MIVFAIYVRIRFILAKMKCYQMPKLIKQITPLLYGYEQEGDLFLLAYLFIVESSWSIGRQCFDYSCS